MVDIGPELSVSNRSDGRTSRRRTPPTAYTVSAMLEQFTLQAFTPRIGEAFQVDVGGAAPLALVLDAVTEIPVNSWRPDDTRDHRTPFSLVFVCASPAVLRQATYRFEHPALGAFDLFIVPVGRVGGGVAYEAVFS